MQSLKRAPTKGREIHPHNFMAGLFQHICEVGGEDKSVTTRLYILFQTTTLRTNRTREYYFHAHNQQYYAHLKQVTCQVKIKNL